MVERNRARGGRRSPKGLQLILVRARRKPCDDRDLVARALPDEVAEHREGDVLREQRVG